MIHRYDSVDRFLLVVEQLDVAVELARAGSLSKSRMALIAADNLAELLLVQHAQRVFEASEGSHWMRRRRYGALERDKTLRDFNRKLTLAQQPAEGPAWRAVDPILESGDATVMRVAHRYRNGVYHEDRHNATLLGPLTSLYLQAIGRMFSRGFRPGTAIGGGLRSRVAPLAKWGYELPEDAGRPGSFEFHAAAKIVTSRICDPLSIELPELSKILSSDLLLRNSRALNFTNELLADGMPPDRLTFVIFWSQFWRAHGADDDAQKLDDERHDVSDQLQESDAHQRPKLEAELVKVEDAYIKHSHKLQNEFDPEATLATFEEVAKFAPRLSNAKTLGALLERYELLDKQLRALEEAISEAAYAWGEMVDRAIDEARGN